MKKKQIYSAQTRAEALGAVAMRRDDQTIADIADRFAVQPSTLKGWMKDSKKQALTSIAEGTKAASAYTPAEQLDALLEAAGLSDAELSAWCRQRGLFAHHLQQFKSQLGSQQTGDAGALREAKRREEKLTRELQRKDKALAEAAALLVLQKKFQSLFSEEAP